MRDDAGHGRLFDHDEGYWSAVIMHGGPENTPVVDKLSMLQHPYLRAQFT